MIDFNIKPATFETPLTTVVEILFASSIEHKSTTMAVKGPPDALNMPCEFSPNLRCLSRMMRLRLLYCVSYIYKDIETESDVI